MAILTYIKDHAVCHFGKADEQRFACIPPISHYLRGRTILLADSTVERYRLGEMLVGAGAMPTLVTTGTAVQLALNEAANLERPFDAAVIDAHLAGADGHALARSVHGHPGLQGNVVLLLEPDRAPLALPASHETGIAAYLRRPIRLASLCDALIMALTQ